ncbi:bifunctional epoxide hydrolase 2-like, partial [Malurus melanocephalus]|uniref:bifunctional epoxide hydrolase 2-like n=1 Tax=Malurus melanocephalus TaxID=175006 RepID=UPI002547B763
MGKVQEVLGELEKFGSHRRCHNPKKTTGNGEFFPSHKSFDIPWGLKPQEVPRSQKSQGTGFSPSSGSQSSAIPGVFSRRFSGFFQAIFLDDLGENLKPARDLGMATILVRDPDSALRQLQELSGVQLLGVEEPLPEPCDPSQVTHGYVTIRPGVRLHFVELGQGPALCLCHGFPESWLSWRFQIPALADAGFRVIALEMKGYGESTAPPDIPEYSQEQICKDFVTFLDKLGIPQVVLVGHDWGGAVAWNVALFYPERLRAVASLNTPYRPADPNVDILEKLESRPAFEYQLYFQEPGVAEAELEKDIGRTLKILIRSWE